MVDFERLIEEERQKNKTRKINNGEINDNMATNAKQTKIVKTRNFSGKTGNGEVPPEKKYDFDNSKNIKEFVDRDIEVLNGFTKESEMFQTLQGTMIIRTLDDQELHTVKTSSAVLIEQFEGEKAQGLPFRARVQAVASKSSDNTYLTFVASESD